MSSFATGLSAATTAGFEALDNKKIGSAAKDFEALLLTQILRSAHEEGGWLGADQDDAGSAAIGLGEEQLARTMSASGGLGLAKMIEAGLRNQAITAK